MSRIYFRRSNILCTVLLLSLSLVFIVSPAESKPTVKVEGRQLLEDFDQDGAFKPYLIKGVGYSDTPIGSFHSQWGLCFHTGEDGNGQPLFDCPKINEFENTAVLERDFPLLQEMNINTIRTVGKVTSQLLHTAKKYGIKVIAGFWINPNLDYINGNLIATKEEFKDYVRRHKNHPALLAWSIGYQLETQLCSFQGAGQECSAKEQALAMYRFLNQLAHEAKTIEGDDAHPCLISSAGLGKIGSWATDDILPDVDIHGVNLYSQLPIDYFFEQYVQLTQKPVLIMEYGIDAWQVLNKNKPERGVERQDLQARYLASFWDNILEYHTANGGPALGGFVGQWADIWWLYNGEWKASASEHDYGYFNWQYADDLVNPEWQGIVALEKNAQEGQPDVIHPRLAVDVLRYKFSEQPKQRPVQALARPDQIVKDMSWYYTAGMHFSPLVNGRINQLGGFFKGVKEVSLWEKESGKLLAQAKIDGKNKWTYVDIPPVKVEADKVYTVAVRLDGSGGAQYLLPQGPQDVGDIKIYGGTFTLGDERPTQEIKGRLAGLVDVGFKADSQTVNMSPRIVEGPVASKTIIKPGETVSLTVKAQDPDGDALIYDWRVTGGAIQGSGPTVQYQAPLVEENQMHNIIVLVTDQKGGFDFRNVLVEVESKKGATNE